MLNSTRLRRNSAAGVETAWLRPVRTRPARPAALSGWLALRAVMSQDAAGMTREHGTPTGKRAIRYGALAWTLALHERFLLVPT